MLCCYVTGIFRRVISDVGVALGLQASATVRVIFPPLVCDLV